MQIERLRIENFRALTQPVEIGPLAPGLNLLAGDNEAGKTTVLDALRAALFDRHSLTGKAAAALQPYGHKVGPEVTLDFRADGNGYRLWKRFCQRPGARLEGPRGVASDDAAEDALQALLGFQRPRKGATDNRYQGVWGLLWVAQGTAFDPVSPAETARNALGAVLEAEVGNVLGGAVGQRLLERFRAARAEYWTATGRPGKALREAGEKVEALRDELAEVDDTLAGFERDVAELERRQRELAELDDPAVAEELQARLRAAESRAQQLADRRAECERVAGEHRVAAAEAERLEGLWRERQRLARELADARETLERRQAGQRDVEAGLVTAEAEETAARQALDEALTAEREAGDRLRRSEARRARRGQATELARLREVGNRARTEARAARQAREAADAVTITAGILERLRAAADRHAQAAARLEAGGTAVHTRLSVPVATAGAVSRVAEDEYRVTGEARLSLEGVGEIHIRPGGSDLASARAELEAAQREFGEIAEPHGVATLADAEAALRRRDRCLADADAHERVLAAHAPDGLDALERTIAEAERELAVLAEAVGGDEVDDPDADVAEARQAQQQAAADVRRARDRLERATRSAAAQRETRAAEAARCEAEAARVRQIDGALASARADCDDDTLYARLAEARRAEQSAAQRLAEAESALAEADPETVDVQLETARAATAQHSEQRASVARQVADLRARLEALGHQGLGERRVGLDSDLAAAEDEHRRLEREAGAVKLAADALERAAGEARRTFLAPVTERLRPYLRLLMPEAELLFDDELAVTGVRRHGVDEPFERLSLGTREQIATLVRLAFADLLAERGEAVPVVLDDALTFADEARFDAMKTALARAARRHQVLVLTCRPRDYLSLGAPVHRL